MVEYNVFAIPYPPSEEHITRYATIRLQGLQTDPQAFGSSYERESRFTRGEWRARLDSSDKTTFVARTAEQLNGPTEGDDWIGTATVLHPITLRDAGFGGYQHLVVQDEVVYMLVGMWVNPDHRRQGIGRLLIAAVKEFVQTKRNETRKLLLLEVHDHNLEASRLYESMGFTNRGIAGDSGEFWMSLRLSDNPMADVPSFGNSIHTHTCCEKIDRDTEILSASP